MRCTFDSPSLFPKLRSQYSGYSSLESSLASQQCQISGEFSFPVTPNIHFARELLEGNNARENIGCVFLGGDKRAKNKVHGSLMTKAQGWLRSLTQRDPARDWQVSVCVWGPRGRRLALLVGCAQLASPRVAFGLRGRSRREHAGWNAAARGWERQKVHRLVKGVSVWTGWRDLAGLGWKLGTVLGAPVLPKRGLDMFPLPGGLCTRLAVYPSRDGKCFLLWK